MVLELYISGRGVLLAVVVVRVVTTVDLVLSHMVSSLTSLLVRIFTSM